MTARKAVKFSKHTDQLLWNFTGILVILLPGMPNWDSKRILLFLLYGVWRRMEGVLRCWILSLRRYVFGWMMTIVLSWWDLNRFMILGLLNSTLMKREDGLKGFRCRWKKSIPWGKNGRSDSSLFDVPIAWSIEKITYKFKLLSFRRNGRRKQQNYARNTKRRLNDTKGTLNSWVGGTRNHFILQKMVGFASNCTYSYLNWRLPQNLLQVR